jgi:hypothetical protein
MTTERVPNARAVATSMGRLVRSTSSATRGRPLRTTSAAAECGSSSRYSDLAEAPVRAHGARRSVLVDGPAGAVHEVEVGALVAHSLDQPLERLLVDQLHVERRVDRRRQLAQQRELLDGGLEVAELLLELVVRVEDLFRLEREHAFGVLPALALPKSPADRAAQ